MSNEETAQTHDASEPGVSGRYGSAAVRNLREALNEVPEQIGRYRIRERIGGGGMGEVYAADQSSPIKRKVAVKIIKAGMDSKQVVARFEAERQALAMMDHPNIARVLDAGTTETGRPYFVMELVRGIPITQFCDQNKLSTRQRIELLIPVCQAVQHAHQKGIIHRDLKPSNVLVTLHDGVAVPKVIDFGIAKATNQQLTENTVYTEFRAMIGTPAYMSPEQAEMSGLDIDTRSDIYSLGVLMYELITGSTPFETSRLLKAGLMEIQKIIAQEEPPRPSQRLSTLGEALTTVANQRGIEPARLGKLIAGELDWIVMKALDKDRRRRYDSASDFAADLQRHLAGEPVVAAPPSAAYRIQKFVRRYKTAIVTSSLILGLLIASVIVSGLLAVRARTAERQLGVQLSATQSEERVAETERDQANEARRQAADSERKATDSERRATEQAINSDLLAHYINAQYMLSQGRVGPAFNAITDAISIRPHWEYGSLLSTIVAEARKSWSLVANLPGATAPGTLAVFAGKGERILAACTGSRLSLFDVAAMQQIGETDLGINPRFLVRMGDKTVVAADSQSVKICLLDEPANNRSMAVPGGVIDLVGDPTGEVFVTLGSNGEATVFDSTRLQPLAHHHFNVIAPRPGLGPHSNALAISPSGRMLIFHSGLWTLPSTVWNWRDDKAYDHDFGSSTHVRYLSDQTVVNVDRWESSVEQFGFGLSDLRDLKKPAVTTYFPSRASEDPSVWSAAVGNGKTAIFAASTSADSIDIFCLSDRRMLSSTRFSTLLPTGQEKPRYLTFSPTSGLLAVASPDAISVFQIVRQDVGPDPNQGVTPMAFWSLASARDGMYTANRSRSSKDRLADLNLTRRSYTDGKTTSFKCRWPQSQGSYDANPWGLSSTSDGKTVAVLWQENSGGGNIDADYFRKAIVIYDVESAPDAEGKLVPVRTIWLDKYKGVNGRNNRAICISPDGSAVAFFVADGDDSIYRVSDGSVIAEIPAGPTVAWSPDGSLFATGTYLQNDPVQVWSTASGKLVSSTAATGEIRTLAISPDNHRLYVGWNTSTLECFDVSSGASVSKIKTPISPLAISPRGDRFLGFLPDSDTHGSIVLGSLPAAETILVLNEGAHVLNRAYFSASGDAIACTISRDYAALGRSLSVKHATQLLNQLTPFVPTAEVVPRAAKFPSAANP